MLRVSFKSKFTFPLPNLRTSIGLLLKITFPGFEAVKVLHSEGLPKVNSVSVSYTHLDVYKRQ